MTGKVVTIVSTKDYGFIRDLAGKDIFFHVTDCLNSDHGRLMPEEGDEVEFEYCVDNRGRGKARRVIVTKKGNE